MVHTFCTKASKELWKISFCPIVVSIFPEFFSFEYNFLFLFLREHIKSFMDVLEIKNVFLGSLYWTWDSLKAKTECIKNGVANKKEFWDHLKIINTLLELLKIRYNVYLFQLRVETDIMPLILLMFLHKSIFSLVLNNFLFCHFSIFLLNIVNIFHQIISKYMVAAQFIFKLCVCLLIAL